MFGGALVLLQNLNLMEDYLGGMMKFSVFFLNLGVIVSYHFLPFYRPIRHFLSLISKPEIPVLLLLRSPYSVVCFIVLNFLRMIITTTLCIVPDRFSIVVRITKESNYRT